MNRNRAAVVEVAETTKEDGAARPHQPTRQLVGDVPARAKLRKRAEQLGGTSVVADLLGCSGRYVRMLMSPMSGTLPSLPMSKKIADELGILQSDWCEPAQEPGKETNP